MDDGEEIKELKKEFVELWNNYQVLKKRFDKHIEVFDAHKEPIEGDKK